MLIDEWDLADEARRIGTRPRTIGELFAVERPSLKPLPVETFETGRWFTPRVDRFSQITVRTNRYSVPTRFIGRQVRVLLHASELVVFDGRTEIAQHERLLTKSGSRLELVHYLEALLRKPGALPGATVLEQARAAGQFTPIHEAWWTAACNAHGDTAGTRALIEVLLLHRHMQHDHVVAGSGRRAPGRSAHRGRGRAGSPPHRRQRRTDLGQVTTPSHYRGRPGRRSDRHLADPAAPGATAQRHPPHA
jgi:hypothetical protein